jgi:hypothetical protein
VLDVDRLRPGTLILDDSAPHCFSVPRAIARHEARRDILFTEGGVVRVADEISRTRYAPSSLSAATVRQEMPYFAPADTRAITSCVLSSLLTMRCDDLAPTTGSDPGLAECSAHYRALESYGVENGALHCDTYVLDAQRVAEFRDRFGRT